MVNTPIPASLKSEAKKAAKILKEFTIPNAKVGPDKIIPAGLVAKAQGLAILTVMKLGFLVTARGGSGIVIAKLGDGSWSAPSAIGIAGLGGGFEIGAEVTDFVIILNKSSAVEAFSKGGNLTLGGNFTIAAGPLGRNVEGDVSLRSPAAIYTYSKTKGLFAGISIEGSALIERKDANKKFYGEDIRAVEILSGEMERPPACAELYEVLERHDEMFTRAALAFAKREAIKEGHRAMEGRGLISRVKNLSFRSKKPTSTGSGDRRSSCPDHKEEEEYGNSDSSLEQVPRSSQTAYATSRRSSSPVGSSRTEAKSKRREKSYQARPQSKAAPRKDLPDWDSPPKARAIWGYKAQMNCDLSFKPGDEIILMTCTTTQDDWWEGQLGGQVGIFPANYVKVL